MNIKCGNKNIIIGKKTYIMGILNITPDSFSDGGRFNIIDKAILHAEKLIQEGADIIDIGAESSRPFSSPITLKEELNRIVKIVKSLVLRGINNISIDTNKSEVAKQCLNEGASWINDVSALSDKNMLKIIHNADAIIIMHNKSNPQTMHKTPIIYNNMFYEIKHFLQQKIQLANINNIPSNKILIDPGIGFGKNIHHNIELSKYLNIFKNISSGIVYGASRKKFLGQITNIPLPQQRDNATLSTTAFATLNNINIIRVHNVKKTKHFLKVLYRFKT